MTSTAAALALADTAPTPLAERILDTLVHRIGKDARAARPHDWLNATCLTVRDDVIERWMTSTREAHAAGKKRVYYLSLEFLIGRLLRDALSNLGLTEEIAAALSSLGVELDLIEEIEPDAALGNGGLGRLAACFMESLSTLGLPAYGYGIRYVNGMFRQRIDDGWQVELPETWLAYGNPWEFQRRESAYPIGFGGEVRADEAGLTRWQPAETLIAEAFDTPVVGWRGARVNTLRLWNARAVDPIQLDRFNAGDHLGALADASRAETLTRVLYPADSNAAGQELRLRQEYFFSSASLQDIVRRHMQYVGDISSLPDHAAIQLNDTHPAVSVAELMRILLDQHDLAGDHIYKMDYELMLQQHCDSGADVTVACMEAPRAEATGFGVMAIDERGRKTDFVEKPADPPPMPGKPDVSLVSMGIYVFHTRFLFDQLKRDAETPGSSRDFGKDIIPHLVGLEDTVIDANEAALASGVATGFQFDGVTPEALDRVLGRVLRLYARPDAWRAVQRQGMRADVSWARSGRRYADLYAELLNRRTPA